MQSELLSKVHQKWLKCIANGNEGKEEKLNDLFSFQTVSFQGHSPTNSFNNI